MCTSACLNCITLTIRTLGKCHTGVVCVVGVLSCGERVRECVCVVCLVLVCVRLYVVPCTGKHRVWCPSKRQSMSTGQNPHWRPTLCVSETVSIRSPTNCSVYGKVTLKWSAEDSADFSRFAWRPISTGDTCARGSWQYSVCWKALSSAPQQST